MTAEEKAKIVEELHNGARLLAESLDGVGDDAASRKPAPEEWSVLECVEHVVAVEENLLARILAAQPSEGTAIDPQREQALPGRVRDRSRRVSAPRAALPANRFADVAGAHRAFLAARQRSLSYVEGATGDLRQLFTTHPVIPGPVNKVEMLLMLALHPQRHAAQIREIRGRIGRSSDSENLYRQ